MFKSRIQTRSLIHKLYWTRSRPWTITDQTDGLEKDGSEADPSSV